VAGRGPRGRRGPHRYSPARGRRAPAAKSYSRRRRVSRGRAPAGRVSRGPRAEVDRRGLAPRTRHPQRPAAPHPTPPHHTPTTTRARHRSKRVGPCPRQKTCKYAPINAIQCCADATTGCITSIRLTRDPPPATPPKGDSLDCQPAAGDAPCDTATVVNLAPGDFISNFTTTQGTWAGGGARKRCMLAVTFNTAFGSQLMCGNPAGGNSTTIKPLSDAQALADEAARGRRLLTRHYRAQPQVWEPPAAATCLSASMQATSPAPMLCSLKLKRCSKPPEGQAVVDYFPPECEPGGRRGLEGARGPPPPACAGALAGLAHRRLRARRLTRTPPPPPPT
jgi:hypothetical protein